MTEYYQPAGYGESEYVEKKSRFIGQIWPITDEAEAREKIDAVRKKYHDARHNCWCYLLKDGTLRYSDDGEPQGTAGQPMLEVFAHLGVTDLVCVVTRYFGGILLGTGGLTRAYSRSAKESLMASGVLHQRSWSRVLLPIGYSLYERVRLEVRKFGGIIEDTDYGADIMLTLLLPQEDAQSFLNAITELSSGTAEGEILETVFHGAPEDIFSPD